jgi:hypothetical protein
VFPPSAVTSPPSLQASPYFNVGSPAAKNHERD